jgi:eukaryotic-like serine/threonine-protein kinase
VSTVSGPAVAGRYQLQSVLGRGGMAVVLRGERADGRFEKEVAIKLLPAGGGGAGHERLLEEIRILARLEHPHIARLIDGGIDDQGVPYLVMEYVHGTTLTEYCQDQNLDINARLKLFADVIAAVAYAHSHLVVHCDIKPGNVLVTKDGQVRLVDFGIANLLSGARQHAPQHPGVLCSPAYAAP